MDQSVGFSPLFLCPSDEAYPVLTLIVLRCFAIGTEYSLVQLSTAR